MHKMVFGVFDRTENANSALEDLYKSGLQKNDISVILQDSVAKQGVLKDTETTGQKAAGGAAAGTAAGAALGALAGYLVGIGAIAIPGLGALLLAGPIAQALGLAGAAAAAATGAVGGAITGGLVGALVNMGVPKEKALVYEQRIKAGDVLIAVNADNEQVRQNAEKVFASHGAGEINYYTLTK